MEQSRKWRHTYTLTASPHSRSARDLSLEGFVQFPLLGRIGHQLVRVSSWCCKREHTPPMLSSEGILEQVWVW